MRKGLLLVGGTAFLMIGLIGIIASLSFANTHIYEIATQSTSSTYRELLYGAGNAFASIGGLFAGVSIGLFVFASLRAWRGTYLVCGTAFLVIGLTSLLLSGSWAVWLGIPLFLSVALLSISPSLFILVRPSKPSTKKGFCLKCGTKLPPKSEFCPSCGHKAKRE